MSKFINRKKRKARSKEDIFQLLKDTSNNDTVIDEYIFRFGADYMTQEKPSWSPGKYDHMFMYLIKERLLK